MKKTYLNKLSTEEIIKRLHNGEIVKIDGDETTYQLVDNIMIKHSIHNMRLFGYGFTVNSSNDYYFEDPEPITKTGIYRLKNGKKAFICSVKPHIIFGAIEDSATISRWNPNGGAYMNDVLDKDHEIVGKWEEK